MAQVTVVVRNYNRLHLLSRALASLAGQTFRDFDVLVVDDASADGSAAWLRELAAGRDDLTVIVDGGAAPDLLRLAGAAMRALGYDLPQPQ